MNQSTSFAQMANKQSISLSSALRANTPPTKGQTTSRKFLSLSIFFRLLLVMFLTLTVSAEVWGAALTGSYTKITNISNLSAGDRVVLYCDANSVGVTGWNNNKDATVATTGWVEYLVEAASGGVYLKDENVSKYIASPGSSNQFLYGTKAVCTVDANGVLKCNSRLLYANGTNYRMYSSIQNTYKAFYVYKVLASTPYTVTLKDDNSTLTQASAGASVTLPSRAGCTGYTFAGWTKTWVAPQSSWTTTAPTIIPAGSYTPAADENLYPVYTKTESGGSSTASSKSISSTSTSAVTLETGKPITYTCSESNTYSNPARIYKTKSITIAGGTITSISLTGVSGYAISNMTANTGTLTTNGNNGTWTGSASSITFTASTAQTRISAISVTYSGGSTTSYISVPDCGDPCASLQAPNVTDIATENSITLSWDAVPGATSYNIYNFTTDTEDETTELTYTFTGLAPETEYEWGVESAKGVCSKGTEGTTTTLTACDDAVNVKKGTPSNGSFTMVSGYQSTCNGPVTVTLSNIQPATGYQFSEITQSGVDDAKVTIDNTEKTVTYAKNTTGTSTINVTFIEIPKYTVTLNPNYPNGKTGTFKDKGGNTVSGNLVLTYDYNTASMSLTDLYQSIELEGYHFNGWYSATSGGSKWTSTGTITKDVTVYAQWSKLHTVTFNTGTNNPTVDAIKGTSETGITLPAGPTPTCTDWTFAGWWTEEVSSTNTSPGTLLKAGDNYTPTEDCTLHAVYSYTEAGGGGSDVTFNFSNIATANSWTNGTAYTTVTISPITLNAIGGGNNGKYYTSNTSWRMYNGGSLQISTDIGKITSVSSNPSKTFTINDEGIATSSFSETTEFKSITVSYSSTTTTYNSNPTCDICENILTINKGAETNGTFTLDKVGEQETCDGLSVLVTPTPAEHYHVASVTASTSETAVNNGDGTYTITYAANSTGESTINVTFEEDAKASITLSELGEPTTDNTTYYVGETYTLPSTSSQSCEGKQLVGWSRVEVAETDTKPTENYYELGAEITLETAQTFYAVFVTPGPGGGESVTWKETFDTNNGTGGNDSQWSGTIATSELLSDHTWSFYNAKGAKQCAKFASNSNGGSATTPEIDCGSSTEATLTFKAGSWKGDETTLNIESTNCTVDLTSVDLPDQEWGEYIVNIANIKGKITITFSSLLKNRFFLDEVEITTSGATSYSDYSTTCDNTKATITYDLNGGTGATCGKTIVTKDVEFSLCNQTPTNTGYDFVGWTDGVNTYNAGASTSVTDNTKFYAAWIAKTIKITWDQNYTDCPVSETSKYIYDGEDIEMPEDPIRTGYKFTGWYTASTDGTKITEVGTTNKPTDDVTYYAHWNELYSVTFMVSGQVYVVQEDKYLSGANLELPADPSPANYACDGYIFDGWSVAEKTIEEATKPELITNPTITKDEIYYAVWKKATTEGAGETIFYESFNDNDADGGNDGKFNTASNTEECYVDNEGWEGNKFYEADQCIKLGGSSAKGYITTPKLSQLSGNATLSFKAAAWENNSEQTDLVLSITGGGTLDKTSVTMIKGAWKTYEVTIKDGTSATRITFAGKNTSNSRFFLDEVKVTTSGGYNYTTLPSCGPTIVAKEGMWVTSSNGQSVKVNIPIAVKSFTTTATITGTSTSSNFVVTPLENVSNGINDVVEVIYTPTTADTKEETTITLTAKNGEEILTTTTFTLNGRSLPDEFVIVANKGDKNYALPANMAQANVYAGLVVEVNGEEVIAAPKSYLYNVRAVHSTRFDENGTAIRLVGNNDACLWASNAVSGTSIRNWAKLENANTANYEWYLYTEDGDTYYISSTAVTEEGRVLRLYGNNFGMYKEGVNTFRFFPVGCTSTPMNVQTSTTRTSATISWTNASECNVVVKQGSTTVQSISAAASPVVVSNLAESTAYTFTLTPADNESCVASGAFTTTGPTIDIVEWETNGILIQVDKDNELNPKVVIKGEEEHGNVGGNVADELFFSKYFEAHAENKLLAIFNGTTATIDLTGYTIKSENGTLDLSQFGQTKGKVASNEEIILVYYDANYSAEKCAEEQQGYENWNILTEKSVLAFSGRGSIGLYKNDVLIDVIGSTFPSGELTKIGKSDQGCGTEDDVRLHIDGNSVNDESSFFCFNGDNIKTDNVETDYALSTNRCLLIRKNTVTSGANAVATNKATVDATCGELSSTFATLCSEWSGFRIGSGKSSTDEIKNATCDGLGYVGGFDYNNYYRTLETLDNSKTLNEYTRNADENTYFIEIEDLAQYSCLNIQLQLTDNVGNVLTEQTSQVPILVAGEKSTTDEIFSAIVKDSETSEPDYETSKIRCSTCDVVILKNATLTKADAETVKDVNQVRDIYIYPGGKLVVPANATDYSVNNVSLRRVQDEVAAADIQAPLNITSSSKAPIFVDVRIDANNWHWFALPYDCNIADVTWADGSKAAYNTDWFLMYYDGESRAASTNPYDNHWKVYNGTKIEAGKGYIVGITGDISKPAVKFELRFPMAQKVLTAEQTDKTVPVNAWGVKSDNKPNNLGWNLVGNPYLNYYKTADEYSPLAGLPLIKYTGIDPVTGDRLYDDSGNVPYVATPIDGGWYEYRQELASEVNMMPFTAYFVQVGDPNKHANGEALDASFEASNRGKKSIVRRAPREVEEIEEPIIVRVELTNSKGESDKTSLVIDDRFTNDYEMNGDFFKWFGDYYNYYTKPVLYTIGADQGKRAFNALNEELAKQPIPMGMYAAQAGNYTFSLNQQFDLSRVEEVWLHDATQSTYTNLMQSDYTFSTSKVNGAGRFSLSVKLAPKVATGMENVNADKVWATTQNQQIIVNGLENNTQLWIYDAAGKLLYTEVTSNYQHRYSVPQVGTYFIALQKGTTKQTIKVVVE